MMKEKAQLCFKAKANRKKNKREIKYALSDRMMFGLKTGCS